MYQRLVSLKLSSTNCMGKVFSPDSSSLNCKKKSFFVIVPKNVLNEVFKIMLFTAIHYYETRGQICGICDLHRSLVPPKPSLYIRAYQSIQSFPPPSLYPLESSFWNLCLWILHYFYRFPKFLKNPLFQKENRSPQSILCQWKVLRKFETGAFFQNKSKTDGSTYKIHQE